MGLFFVKKSWRTSPGQIWKDLYNFFLGREAETDDSSRKGLILVWPFVKVARQTYATSAKQKDLDLNSFMLVLWYRINLLFYSTFPAWLSPWYLAYYYYFNYKFLSRSICLELIAGWTSKVNLSWIIILSTYQEFHLNLTYLFLKIKTKESYALSSFHFPV